MGRILLTALVLGYKAASAIQIPDFANLEATGAIKIPGNFANLEAAATTNPAVTACSIAYEVLDSCISESPGFSTAPASDVASCICCYSTIEIDEFYASCAGYIATEYPASTSQYSDFSDLAVACQSEMPVCAAGAGGGGSSPTSTTTSTTTRRTGTTISTTSATATRTTRTTSTSSRRPAIDPACASFQDIVQSCVAATPTLTAVANSVAASCLCYTTRAGTTSYTTDIDDLASSCATYAETEYPTSYYEAVVAFETFCEDYSPKATRSSTRTTSVTETETTTSATRTPGGIGGGGGSSTTTSTSSRSSSVPPRPNAAPGAAGGLVVWAANMLTFVLSAFFLI